MEKKFSEATTTTDMSCTTVTSHRKSSCILNNWILHYTIIKQPLDRKMSSISELLNNRFSLFNLFPMINVCMYKRKEKCPSHNPAGYVQILISN